MALPIPQQLLDHPAINDHPYVRDLHQRHGGVPEDADDGTVEAVLAFTNAVATGAVEPGTKTRRTDPSPRRTARVWRSEILGHREPSPSPQGGTRRRLSFTESNQANIAAARPSTSPGASPGRVRYRSRSRPPTTSTVKEEPYDPQEDSEVGTGVGVARAPGRRDLPNTTTAVTALEHRVSTMVQQQHEFHDRLLQRMAVLERRMAQGDARNSNKINSYLGRPLVPVTNGKAAVPRDLTPLTSLEVIHTLPLDEVDKWLEYYTGARPAAGDERAARQALRVCTGVEVDVQVL